MNSTLTAPRATRREWIGLLAIALPCMVVVVDLTVLHLAIPTVTVDLQPSPSQMLWIVDIYGFLLAGSLITMGTLGDRIGRRKLLLIGGAAFAAASVLAAFSNSPGMLIVARAVLGIAGATLAPSTLSLIRSMFHDPGQRTQAIALWGTSFAAGSALGPLVGGFLLEHFWWGAVFLVPVPVMALLLILGPRLLPEYRDPKAGRLDITSAALSILAVLAAIYGFKLLAQDGLGWMPILSIVVGLVLGAWFVRRQQHLEHPLIDLKLFRVPAFSATLIVFMLNAFVMFAASFFAAQYFQLVLGLSPLHAGLWTLPAAVSVIIGTTLVPTLVRLASKTVVIIAGLVVCALGFGVLMLVGSGGLAVLVIGSVLTGLGAGPLAALIPDVIVGSAPPEGAGSAASISSTSVEFGGALGLALLGSVGVAVYRSVMTGAIPTGLPPEAALTAGETIGGAVAVARDLPPDVSAQLLGAAHNAFAQAFVTSAGICTVLMLFAAILMTVVAARRATSRTTEATPLPSTPLDVQSR
jgi:MFS transporter, DHA2 family, multidrug resistance protein